MCWTIRSDGAIRLEASHDTIKDARQSAEGRRARQDLHIADGGRPR
jgi:hypothetical protein